MVERIKARVDPEFANPTNKDRLKGEVDEWVKSVKLLREPKQGDRDIFMADLKRDSAYMRTGGESGPLAGKEDAISDAESENGDVPLIDTGPADMDVTLPSSSQTHSLSPYWTSDKHYGNVIHDVIASYGAKGASSMGLCAALTTTKWRRPFDDAMGKLSDEWHISQPPHLRHLAVIRDTYINGSITHYTFRTIENYQKAVEQGQASWIYYLTDPELLDTLRKPANLDEWGFPVVQDSQIYDPYLPVTLCAQSGLDKLVIKRWNAEAKVAIAGFGGDENIPQPPQRSRKSKDTPKRAKRARFVEPATSARPARHTTPATPATPATPITIADPVPEESSAISRDPATTESPAPSSVTETPGPSGRRPRQPRELIKKPIKIKTPTATTLKKRNIWTKHYEELKAAWEARIMKRARDEVYREELQRFNDNLESPTPPRPTPALPTPEQAPLPPPALAPLMLTPTPAPLPPPPPSSKIKKPRGRPKTKALPVLATPENPHLDANPLGLPDSDVQVSSGSGHVTTFINYTVTASTTSPSILSQSFNGIPLTWLRPNVQVVVDATQHATHDNNTSTAYDTSVVNTTSMVNKNLTVNSTPAADSTSTTNNASTANNAVTVNNTLTANSTSAANRAFTANNASTASITAPSTPVERSREGSVVSQATTADGKAPDTKRRSRKRKAAPTFNKVDILVPEERVTEVANELRTMSRPAGYINEPRAFLLNRDICTKQGRPRDPLLVTIKTSKLKDFEWFDQDEPLEPSMRLRQWVPALFEGTRFALAEDEYLDEDGLQITEVPSTPTQSTKPKRGRKPSKKVQASAEEESAELEAAMPPPEKRMRMSKPDESEAAGRDHRIIQDDAVPQTTTEVLPQAEVESQAVQGAMEAESFAIEEANNEQAELVDATSTDYTSMKLPVAQESANSHVARHDDPEPPADELGELSKRVIPIKESSLVVPGDTTDQASGQTTQETLAETTAKSLEMTTVHSHESPAEALPSAPLQERSERARGGSPRKQFEETIGRSPSRSIRVTADTAIEKSPTAGAERSPENSAEASLEGLIENPYQDMPDRPEEEELNANDEALSTPSRVASLPFSAGLKMWDVVKDQPTRGVDPPARPFRMAPSRKGIGRNSGQVEFQRAKFIMDIMRKCGGIFPGHVEMFFPFASLWLRHYNQVPDRKTLERSLTGLFLSKKLKKINFSFKADEETTVSRYILAEPHIDPDGAAVRDLKDKIETLHPGFYIPPEVPLEKNIGHHIRQRQRPAKKMGYYQRIPTFFTKDRSAIVPPTKVPRLGQLEEDIKAGAEKRRKKRELEEKRETRLQKRLRLSDPAAEEEEELEPEVLERTTEFQLSNYQHQPQASKIDRGPRGRARLTKRLLFRPPWQEQAPRQPALATLRSMRERRTNRQISEAIRRSSATMTTQFINQGLGTYDKAYTKDRILTMTNPSQTFYELTGTFSTDPSQRINLRARSRKLSVAGSPQPPRFEMSLTDIFENSTRFETRNFNVEYDDDEGAAFDREIARVKYWETTNDDKEFRIGMPDTGFINHTVTGNFNPVPTEKSPHFETLMNANDRRRIRYPGEQTVYHEPQRRRSVQHPTPQRYVPLMPQTGQTPTPPSPPTPTLETTSLSRPQASRPRPLPAPAQPSSAMQKPNFLRLRQPLGIPAKKVQTESSRSRSDSLPSVADWSPALQKRRSIKELNGAHVKAAATDSPMTAMEEERLMYAVAVVTALTGGLQQTARCTNYSAVNHAMHFKFDGAYCRQHWGLIKPKHGLFVEQLQQRFRAVFLDAFENDELPELDMAIPEKTDWAGLVDWAQRKLGRDANEIDELPDTREQFDAEYEIEEPAKYEPTKDDFFNHNTSTVRKEDMINSYAYFDPLPDVKNLAIESKRGPSMLLQSWIRANVLTAEKRYNPQAANSKLSTFGNKPLQEALDSMLGQKLIKGATKSRGLPGRNFVIAMPLNSVYPLPWQWTRELFSHAARFKDDLDKVFASADDEEKILRLREDLSNGQSLVAFNMADNGRLDMRLDLPPTDPGFDMPFPKLTKWGFTEGGYRSMSVDRGRLNFPMSVRPTSHYMFSERTQTDASASPSGSAPAEHQELTGIVKSALLKRPISIVPVPLSVRYDVDEETADRIPYWTDIHGKLMKSHLRQLVMTVLYILLTRPGLDSKEMCKVLRGRVWAWELAVLCAWLGKVGILERDEDEDELVLDATTDAEQAEGARWRMAEWWWLVGEALAAQEGEETVEAPPETPGRKLKPGPRKFLP